MSKYKSSTGSYLLRELFYETTLSNKSNVLYSLKDEDHEGYPSLRRLYVEMGDLTEYNFANAFFYNIDHWLRLTECSWFKPYLNAWRKELELKVRSDALRAVMDEAKNEGSRNSYAANRFLLEKGWVGEDGNTNKRGRPSKDEIKAHVVEQAEREKQIQKHWERIQ